MGADLDEMFHAVVQASERCKGLAKATRDQTARVNQMYAAAVENGTPVDGKEIKLHDQLTAAWEDATDRHADLLKQFFGICKEQGLQLGHGRQEDEQSPQLDQRPPEG